VKKRFVLDTNVLLHSAEALESFADNGVILPMAVIEELDKFKKGHNELARNARRVIRRLDELRGQGNLGAGVPLPSGGSLQIVTGKGQMPSPELDVDLADNRILRVAYALHAEGNHVIFVSKDINARIKADALGIVTQDFEKQKVNFDELFTGFRQVTVPAALIDAFYDSDAVRLEGQPLFPNEFAHLVDETNAKHTALGRSAGNGEIRHLRPHTDSAWHIRSRSKEQRMAMELLLDSSVEIVTLVGQAGTGKTLLALAAGLQETLRNQRYEKILVTRPIVPVGQDLGYLPGSKEEKLGHWMQPVFDNLAYILHVAPRNRQEDEQTLRRQVEDLLEDGVVEMEGITYIRGRSIPRQFVIVDEAQNLTPHEVKTIVSRAGEGTKMVLTGDPYQIDNPYLDASSNGLSFAVERLKEQVIHGHVTLHKSERSHLAAIAAEHL